MPRILRANRGCRGAAPLALAAAVAIALLAGSQPASAGEEVREPSRPDLAALLTTPEAPWNARLPGEAGRENVREAEVGGAPCSGRMTLKLRLGAVSRQPVRASVYLIDKQGWFYKSAKDYLVTHLGKTAIELDLGPESADWVPANSLARPWAGSSGAPVVRVGIGLFSPGRWSGPVEVSEARLEPPGGAAPSGAARVAGLTVSPSRPAAGSMVEVAFVLPAAFDNPFDPEAAELDAELLPARGGQPAAVVPAYFDQAYLPLAEGFGERLTPIGPPRWKVRLRPEKQGEYTLRLRWRGARLADVPLIVGPAQHPRNAAGRGPSALELERLANSGSESFLRRLPADPGRALAVLQDGRFQPVAPNAGPIAGWIAPLEWTERWGAWLGAGRYNLEVAAELDAVLDRAAARGVLLPLFVNFDGQFLENDRFRWDFNPLSAAQGGPLAAPSHYYLDETAARDAEALCRYLAARYANHPAVDGLVLAATLGADGVPEWHDRIAQKLSAAFGAPGAGGALRLATLHPLAIRWRLAKDLGSFESKPVPGEGGWRFDTDICPGTKATYSSEAASEGTRSLQVDAKLPGELCLIRSFDDDIFDAGPYELLSFDVRLPAGAPRHLRAMVYLRDRELNWYQELLPGELRPGDWTRFVLDLRAGRNGLQGLGHDRPWDGYSRERLRALGLRFFGAKEFIDRPYDGPAYLDNVRLLGDPEFREAEAPLEILALREPENRRPALFTRVEYAFALNRTFANPFDPECVEVRARVLTPSGRLYTMPGFFDQGYRRAIDQEVTVLAEGGRRKVATPEGAERLEPVGPSLWKVRLAATEPGTHQVTLEVLVPDGKGGVTLAASRKGLTFEASAGSASGFVRMANDGRHFELSSGEFFYPIGMAIRSPSDARDLGRDPAVRNHILGADPVVLWREGGHTQYLDLLDLRGTCQFDDYFRRCGQSGINWARVWMAPWWLGLEWDHRYLGYDGAGRYNLGNAWRMDHVLEEAERNGVRLLLCLTNHGQVSAQVDRQWDFNPYSSVMPIGKLWNAPDRPAWGSPDGYAKRPRGVVDSPLAWFNEEKARRLVRQRLRYVVARWGYSTAIMGWELMSEIEFTGSADPAGRNHQMLGNADFHVAWHKAMGSYLRTIDPYRHPVTTHFAVPSSGAQLWRIEEMDFTQGNAYGTIGCLGGSPNNYPANMLGAPRAMSLYYSRFMGQYNKPTVVSEWGGFHASNTMAILDSELHSGLWAEAMLPLAGATGWWWWLHVHYNDRYGEFAALSRFMKGEDLRGVTTQLAAHATVPPPKAGGGEQLKLDALAIGDGKKRAYAWAYHPRIAWGDGDKVSFAGARLDLNGMAPGLYEVEFWDPARGALSSRDEFATRGGTLAVALPTFKRDLALKVRWKGEAPATPPAAPPATPARKVPPPPPPPSTPARTQPASDGPAEPMRKDRE